MVIRGRSGRGWDAAPQRPARRKRSRPVDEANDPDIWGPDPDAIPAEEAPGESRRRGARRGAPDTPEDQVAAPGEPAPKKPRDQREWAREICLRQLAVRPRTRAELAAALTKRGIEAEIIEEVLDRYDEVGIIDDEAFARAWVDSRHHGKGLARRALGQELRRRGVDQEVIKGALEELEVETEEVTARELVERKLRSTSGEPDAVFRKLVGMLARKGYPPGIAIRAVKDVLARRREEDEDDAESSSVGRMRGVAEEDWAEQLEAEMAQDNQATAEWDRPDRV
ncbi:MAG: regulatory protein RecX [Hamadaea sp.]|nr:regulatory protein RecX [Hamadaea sp.]